MFIRIQQPETNLEHLDKKAHVRVSGTAIPRQDQSAISRPRKKYGFECTSAHQQQKCLRSLQQACLTGQKHLSNPCRYFLYQ
jgi:hypothetical protein